MTKNVASSLSIATSLRKVVHVAAASRRKAVATQWCPSMISESAQGKQVASMLTDNLEQYRHAISDF